MLFKKYIKCAEYDFFHDEQKRLLGKAVDLRLVVLGH